MRNYLPWKSHHGIMTLGSSASTWILGWQTVLRSHPGTTLPSEHHRVNVDWTPQVDTSFLPSPLSRNSLGLKDKIVGNTHCKYQALDSHEDFPYFEFSWMRRCVSELTSNTVVPSRHSRSAGVVSMTDHIWEWGRWRGGGWASLTPPPKLAPPPSIISSFFIRMFLISLLEG